MFFRLIGDAFRQCIAYVKQDVPVQATDPCYPTPCGTSNKNVNFNIFFTIFLFYILKVLIQYAVVPKIAPFVSAYQDIMAIHLVVDVMLNVQLVLTVPVIRPASTTNALIPVLVFVDKMVDITF